MLPGHAPAILCAGSMRVGWLVGLGALTTLALAGGGAALVLLPGPRIDVRDLELDGHQVAAAFVPSVSTHPQLRVEVDRPLSPRQWRVVLDGRPLRVPIKDGRHRLLDLTLPGPLDLGSRHTLQVSAGSTAKELTFEVVPPLDAAITMRLHNLQADRLAGIETTVRFSRPVADREVAEHSLRVTAAQTLRWDDPQTLVALSSGIQLGSQAVAMLEEGIPSPDGAVTRGFRSAGLAVPPALTHVLPSRQVQMYYVNTDDARAAFLAHAEQIDVLSPGWYDANSDGTLTGYGRQEIIEAAHAHRVQIIPLVVNKDVDPDVAHAVLADLARRTALCENLVREAKAYGYAGFQLDFEQVRWTDRDLLTALVVDCAAAFHPAGLNLSIAVIPRLKGDDAATGALLDYFRTWSGAYDFAALAKAADFLSFMTYDEHNGVTPPGPVSSIPWMRRALDFSLQGVPPEKAMLGLPTYYHDWTGVGRLTSSSYADALILAQRYRATPAFDPEQDEMHFTYDTPNGLHHELWYESGDTLRRKLPVLYEYAMRGISVWRLGFEDPAFWGLIPARRP